MSDTPSEWPDRGVEGLQERWSRLLAGETATVEVPRGGAPAQIYEYLEGAGLRVLDMTLDGLVVQPKLSWVLPPMHPRFAFPKCTANLGPKGNREALGWRESNWWLRYLPGAEGALWQRLEKARAVIPFILAFVADNYPDWTTTSIVTNGSYLWNKMPRQEIDVGVVLQGPSGHEPILEHYPCTPLDELTCQGNSPLRFLDLLVADRRILEGAEPGGILGNWCLSGGQPYPYDLRKSTVSAAIRCTYAVAPTIYGEEIADTLGFGLGDLRALAYYFVQEASVLLAYRESIRKASQRLLEANLVLCLAEELATGRVPDDEAQDLIASCERATLDARQGLDSPSTLVRIQGWFGRSELSLLDRTVRRLSMAAVYGGDSSENEQSDHGLDLTDALGPPPLHRAARPEPLERRLRRIEEAVARARENQNPAWEVLLQRYDDWALGPATSHAIALLASEGLSQPGPLQRVHRALLTGDAARLDNAEAVAHLLLWSAIDDPQELLRLDDFSTTQVTAIEAAAQLTSYAHAFLDSCSALEALGEPVSLR